MKSLCCAIALLCAPLLVFAEPAGKQAASASSEPKSGFRGEFFANLGDVQKKLTDLAIAVPAEKYSWRPVEGVRSMSEVYMHVAGGNYLLATFLGEKAPADVPKDLEKITEKAKVLAEMQKSFDHLRDAAMKVSEKSLETRVKLFGNQTTYRGVMLSMLNHLHEHLGQSIAYARMAGVVPPWSRKEG